jgi:hypothetical protein
VLVLNSWGAPRIVPFHDLTLSPAASVLHYGLEVHSPFEFTLNSTVTHLDSVHSALRDLRPIGPL